MQILYFNKLIMNNIPYLYYSDSDITYNCNYNSCTTLVNYNKEYSKPAPLMNINTLINIYNKEVFSSYLTPEILLLFSIFLETLSTSCLKKTLTNKLWFIPVYGGYGISFYIFPKVLTKFSLSSAYTVWCGLGIILTTIVDKIIYKEIITLRKIIGSAIIIFGIKLSK